MPFANRAHSTKIDKLLDDIDKHLENIQYAFIMVTALVIAADDASFTTSMHGRRVTRGRHPTGRAIATWAPISGSGAFSHR
jgi:hypothetical protein